MTRLNLVISILTIVLMLLVIGCGGSGENSSGGDSSVSFDRTNYDLLFSDPDKYKGAEVDIVGVVFTAPERHEGGTYWQMFADPINREWNTMVGIESTEVSIKNGDYVHVKGSVKGEFEDENKLGGKIRGVVLIAESVTVVDALAIAPPAIRVYTGAPDTKTQHDLRVSLDKVEFAETETRIFLTVANNTKGEAMFHKYSVKAMQGKRQFELVSDFSGLRYPEVQIELLPGAESTGVVVLPAMDPTIETRLFMDGNTTHDYSLTFKPYEFLVPAPAEVASVEARDKELVTAQATPTLSVSPTSTAAIIPTSTAMPKATLVVPMATLAMPKATLMPKATATPTSVPTAAPTAQPRTGTTIDNPVSAGLSMDTFDGFSLTIVEFDPDAWPVIHSYTSGYGPPPKPGNRYVMAGIRVQVVGGSFEAASRIDVMQFAMLGSSGVLFEWQDYCFAFPNPLEVSMFQGAVYEGNLCFEIPTDEEDLMIRYEGSGYASGVAWLRVAQPSVIESLQNVSDTLIQDPSKPVGAWRSHPFPSGATWHTANGLDIVVDSVDPDAWDVILAENEFNDPPASGNRYLMITVNVTNKLGGSTPVDVSKYDFDIVGSSGLYRGFNFRCGVLPDELEAILYIGGSTRGNTCFEVGENETGFILSMSGSNLTRNITATWASLGSLGDK